MGKVLVVGGSYFAGRVFIEELLKDGETEIHAFNRGRIRLGMPGVVEHRGDREDPAQIRGAIPRAEWDAIVDFCAYTPAHIATMMENVPGTVRQYLFISTTSIYGETHALPVCEDAPKITGPQPELGARLASYGHDKWRAEQTLRQQCLRTGTVPTILRPAIIYGYYNYAPREQYFFDLIQAGSPVVIPDHDLALFSFIWVVDMARMIMGCIGNEQTYHQDFNLSSDELVSYSRLVDVLEAVAGRKLDVVRTSVAEITRERIPLPFPLDAHLIYSGSKLQRLLNFTFTPTLTGMQEAFRYYQRVRQRMKR